MATAPKKTPYKPPLKRYVDASAEHLPVPILCYKDDVKVFKETCRGLPVAWRDKVASKYAAIFLLTMHDLTIPEIRRVNKARFNANTWLREFKKNQSSL
ncbi:MULTISPECIES: hypothetical protein [Aeromonas]|uniref:hypothetical protein n=1 Tax=Aeromonas TaxID=642 RepID=UPI0016802810|nr:MULTISPECIES: hypothetical protein [Aeromonas]BCK65792.1 hypothetical protein KAM330_47810 [Aeromonas hydrophila]BCR31384.1 hypothetical protein KAM376_43900 [Aeromonas caviae]GJA71847.1 hypothetical protein KAM353_14940 [Aeromonas caviae]GJA81680.1 hypothetical protein KAM355_22400 [Aeromonas caviae]GJB24275.1 hypothetical protein KAM365_20250 [Aeromonas caviae]